MFWMTKHDNFRLIFHYQTVYEQKNIFLEVYFFFWNFKPQTILSRWILSINCKDDYDYDMKNKIQSWSFRL
jgi:hypothetical protein